MKIDDFLLLSGEDIPLTSSNIIIHNPTIQELAQFFLDETSFLTGFEFLFFSKDKMSKNEQQMLSALSDFEVLLALLSMTNDSPMKNQLDCLKKFLLLLFKNYDIEYKKENIILTKDKHLIVIDEILFSEIKQAINQIFPFKQKEGLDFNPQNERAKQIAEKIKKGREKIQKKKKQDGQSDSLFEKYISILSIGLQIPMRELYQCTVYQLLNMFERYEKKEVYDVHLKAQLAGATGMKEVDHWMM